MCNTDSQLGLVVPLFTLFNHIQGQTVFWFDPVMALVIVKKKLNGINQIKLIFQIWQKDQFHSRLWSQHQKMTSFVIVHSRTVKHLLHRHMELALDYSHSEKGPIYSMSHRL